MAKLESKRQYLFKNKYNVDNFEENNLKTRNLTKNILFHEKYK
jgi:hypothetical protein